MTARDDTASDWTEFQSFCVGLPWVGARSLGPEERRALVRRVDRTRRYFAVVEACLVIAGLAAFASGPLLIPGLEGWIAGAFAVTSGVGALGLLSCLTRGRALRRILAGLGSAWLLVAAIAEQIGTRWLGRSPLPEIEHLSAEIAAALLVLGCLEAATVAVRHRERRRSLADAGREVSEDGAVDRFEHPAPPATATSISRIELLPRSGLVVRVDGRPLQRFVAARVRRLAAARPHALRVRLPVEIRAEEGTELRRRSLSRGEREEVERHARALRGWPAGVLVIMATAVLHPFLSRWIGSPWVEYGHLGSAGWALLAAGAALFQLRRTLAARRLEDDMTLRWLVTVEEDGGSSRPPHLEVLPVSQLVWTEDGRPAAWRSDP